MSKKQIIYLAELHHDRASSVPILLLRILINSLQTKPHSIPLILLPSARLKVILLAQAVPLPDGDPTWFLKSRNITLTALLTFFLLQ